MDLERVEKLMRDYKEKCEKYQNQFEEIEQIKNTNITKHKQELVEQAKKQEG